MLLNKTGTWAFIGLILAASILALSMTTPSTSAKAGQATAVFYVA